MLTRFPSGRTSGGANIDLTAVGTGPAHQIRVYADGINTKFKIRAASSDISTKIGKTAVKEQLLVIINGLVQNTKWIYLRK